jgi:hypothetical protein
MEISVSDKYILEILNIYYEEIKNIILKNKKIINNPNDIINELFGKEYYKKIDVFYIGLFLIKINTSCKYQLIPKDIIEKCFVMDNIKERITTEELYIILTFYFDYIQYIWTLEDTKSSANVGGYRKKGGVNIKHENIIKIKKDKLDLSKEKYFDKFKSDKKKFDLSEIKKDKLDLSKEKYFDKFKSNEEKFKKFDLSEIKEKYFDRIDEFDLNKIKKIKEMKEINEEIKKNLKKILKKLKKNLKKILKKRKKLKKILKKGK